MKLSTLLSLSAVGALLLTGAANAQETKTDSTGLSGTNCSQFIDAVETAGLASGTGGAAPSAEEIAAAEDAQDEVIITLFWIHGYQTGKTGIPAVLDQKWMASTVARMVEICRMKGNEALPISQAVKQL